MAAHSHHHHHHHPEGHAHPPARLAPSVLRLSAWQRLFGAALIASLIWAAILTVLA